MTNMYNIMEKYIVAEFHIMELYMYDAMEKLVGLEIQVGIKCLCRKAFCQIDSGTQFGKTVVLLMFSLMKTIDKC